MNKIISNVLITGGTRGLGLEYARFLASKGYNIGITDISDQACKVYEEFDSVEDILDELTRYGVKAWYKSANLTDPIQTEELIKSFSPY